MQPGLSTDILGRAISFYNELLSAPDLSISSRQVLDDALERGKLIFGGRRLTPYLRPHFVTEDDWQRVASTCEIVFRALQKVKDAAVEDDALLDELGITE